MTDSESKKLKDDLLANRGKERDIDKRIRTNLDESDEISAKARDNRAAYDAMHF
jgi:hypothetical protein